MKKRKLLSPEIIHLANLSALNLTKKEIKKFSEQLGETVEYINNLNELNTNNKVPTYQTTKLENIYFDEEKIQNQRNLSVNELFLSAKNKINNYFITKKIL